MPSITQSKSLGDLLKYEAPNLYSRENVTVAAGQNLRLGTVLGRKAADGKVYALDPDATDGTEVAVGILATDTDATLADRDDAIMIARHAIVARNALIWPGPLPTAQIPEAIAQLEARGIVVRDSA